MLKVYIINFDGAIACWENLLKIPIVKFLLVFDK